jgi:hypothetical protein
MMTAGICPDGSFARLRMTGGELFIVILRMTCKDMFEVSE